MVTYYKPSDVRNAESIRAQDEIGEWPGRHIPLRRLNRQEIVEYPCRNSGRIIKEKDNKRELSDWWRQFRRAATPPRWSTPVRRNRIDLRASQPWYHRSVGIWWMLLWFDPACPQYKWECHPGRVWVNIRCNLKIVLCQLTQMFVWGCDFRMNFVTIPYQSSTTIKVSPCNELWAYEIIEPSLWSKIHSFSDSNLYPASYTYSQSKPKIFILWSHMFDGSVW